jgi:nitroreductase
MHTVDRFIRERKSVYPRFFTDEAVEEQLIWEILESANWAPTHKMTEPWRFIVMQGSKLEELGDFLANQYKTQTDEKKFKERKYKDKKKKVAQSAAVIAIVMKRDSNESVPEWEELAAVAAAVQNMWISAHANDLGGYWSSPSSIVGRPEVLPLEEDEHCYGLFYLGKHQMPELPRERGDIREKVRWLKEKSESA